MGFEDLLESTILFSTHKKRGLRISRSKRLNTSSGPLLLTLSVPHVASISTSLFILGFYFNGKTNIRLNFNQKTTHRKDMDTVRKWKEVPHHPRLQ